MDAIVSHSQGHTSVPSIPFVRPLVMCLAGLSLQSLISSCSFFVAGNGGQGVHQEPGCGSWLFPCMARWS